MGETVLLVDDDKRFRVAARALLEAGRFRIVGEAADGAQALAAAKALSPDVVIVDVQLPDTDGFEVAQILKAEGDVAAVILVSSRPASAYGRRLEASGTRGFIPKEDLTAAAVRAMLGEVGGARRIPPAEAGGAPTGQH